MTTAIKFGTSGWRAIVADEFTVANIRLAVAGIAAYVKTLPAPHRVLVGRDPRFLGESFVSEAARVLAARVAALCMELLARQNGCASLENAGKVKLEN